MKRDLRLLIVDDNVATRYALRRRLERHGYEVLESGTGSEGLELIASVAIDALDPRRQPAGHEWLRHRS